MTFDRRDLLAAVPTGSGRALDLGGGKGDLQKPVEQRGYNYFNLDLVPGAGQAVRGDAHRLPFVERCFDIIISEDSLEHFSDPQDAISEARRVLVPGGVLVIWVPFMHPFHGTDFYRYTPLGLRLMLERGGFVIETITAPLWLFSVMAEALVEVAKRMGLGFTERAFEQLGRWLDHAARRFQGRSMAFANAYLVVAHPDDGTPEQAGAGGIR